VAGRDITDGRASRAIAVDLGIGTGTIWQNTGIAYDVAIAGIPFFLGIKDERPYERATAPFRKEQFDSQTNPGEQSLTGWWLRSQNSFHTGEGIYFYDPLSNPYATTISTNSYRIKDAFGVNIWTPGQVSLLRSVTQNHNTLAYLNTNGRSSQTLRTVRYPSGSTYVDAVLLHDGYDIDRIHVDGTVDHWVDYTSGTNDPVYAMCDDGQYAYWVTNDTASGKLELDKKLISASTSTAPTVMFTKTGITVRNAVIEHVKQRLIVAVNNVVYETTTNASTSTSLTTIYTHPNTSYVFSSIAESGTAVYVSGYNGVQSSIFKFVLDTTTGAMPVLSYAITAAEMPAGEVVHKLFYYLGKMMIGTSKGVRVASIDGDGSLTYGPLITETPHPCYDFAARDTYVWCATGLPTANIEPGLIRIDLSQEIDTLRYAYAKDLNYDTTSHTETTACAFFGDTDQLGFCTTADSSAVGYVYIEDATELRTDGYVQTGYIRYNTLEGKHFKRISGLGDFEKGSMSLQTVDLDGNVYDVNSYDIAIGNPESTITQPAGPQDAIGLRFRLYRDATDTTLGPVFKGYQLKALPANPRNRIIKVPLFNFDIETDKYNTTVGYEGRAFDRLAALETAESNGDIVSWQDFRTGETQQVLIEQVLFNDVTPPDKKLTGFGGTISLTIRTV
jgi:hypothetical protein